MKKNRFFTLFCGFCLVLTLAVLPLLVAGAPTGRVQPIKVGVLLPFTGALAKSGQSSMQGLELALDKVGWSILGKEVKVIKADTEGNPATTLTRAKALVEREGVDFIMGPMMSNEALACRDYIDSKGIPMVVTYSSTPRLTRDRFSKYIFRASFSATDQLMPCLADYLYKDMGKRRIVAIAAEYVSGHEFVDGFKKTFESLGGRIIQEIYPPLNTVDFAPYLAKLNVNEAEATFAFYPGGSTAVALVKQYAEFGLKEKVLLTGNAINDPDLLAEEGDACLGIISAFVYCLNLDNRENKSFVKAHQDKYGNDPDNGTELGYVIGRVFVETIKSVKGDTSDKLKMVSAIEKVKFDAPRGTFTFDKHHNPTQSIYIVRTEKRDGKYVNTVVKTYKEIHQGWMPSKP